MSITETSIDDTLEALGVVAGGLLVLAGIGTIVGMPWQTNGSITVSIVQVFGILGTIAIGAGLLWLSRQTDE